jgi:hypothetical protein
MSGQQEYQGVKFRESERERKREGEKENRDKMYKGIPLRSLRKKRLNTILMILS